LIDPTPSSSNGRPFRRFFGRTGVITEKRGKSYIVKIKDGKKEKELITRPEHLKAI
jgi:large subunit ribosomal protein L21e